MPAGRRTAPSTTRVARDPEPREITDPRTIRALAHPVRLALLELLLREGPLTATEAGRLLDDSPGNMSWHLQTMARYGFVEEAGGGRGRARPWRLVAAGNRLRAAFDDPERSRATAELERVFHERLIDGLRQWMAVQHGFPTEWQEAAFGSDNISYLTPAEMCEIGEELTAVLMRYRDRTVDRAKRPADAKPVHLMAFGHPLPPTPAGN
jgi:DNA-binding transcriptional ArsR family regulator